MSSPGTPTASRTTATTRCPRRLNLMYESLTSPTILTVALTTPSESADESGPGAATAAWTQPISSLLLRFATHHNRRHPSAPLDAASLQLEDRGGERFLPTTLIGAAVDAVDAVGASASTTKGTARAAFASTSLDLFVRINEQIKAKNAKKQKQEQGGTGSGSPARQGRGAGGGANKGEAGAGGSTGEEAKSTGEEGATGEAKNQDNGERSSDDPVPLPRPAFSPLLLRSRSAPVSPTSRSSQLSTADLAATLRRVGGGRRRAWLHSSHGATAGDAGGRVGDLAGEAKQSKDGENIVAREGPPPPPPPQQQQQQEQQQRQEHREAREAEEDQQSRTSPSSTAAFLRSRTTVGDRYRESNTHSTSSTSSASSSSLASPASSASSAYDMAASASASVSSTGLLRPPDDSRSGVLDNGLCFYIARHDKPRKEVRLVLRDAIL